MPERLNILLVARHFPPEVSGGARRPALIAKGLRQLGHRVVVASPFGDGETDQNWISLPGGEMEAHDAPPSPESPAFALAKGVMGRLRLPDGEIKWARESAAIVRDAVLAARKAQPFDWIVTTSPPESIHHIGYEVKRATGLNWAADFRDSWLRDPIMPIRRRTSRRRREMAIAKRWLAACDVALAPTRFICDELSDLRPAMRVIHLPQPVEIASRSAPDFASPQRDHWLHAGQFSLSDPNGRNLEDLIRIFDAARQTRPTLTLELLGRLSAREAELAGGRPYITYGGSLPRAQTLRRMADASGLVAVARPGSTAVPGKIFEYASSGRPILIVGDGPWLKEVGVPRPLPNPVSTLLALSAGEQRSGHVIQTHSPRSVAHTLIGALVEHRPAGTERAA
ncbi:MAG: hypothetical protein WBF53_06105 [Litorimonas sp.]